MNDGSEEGESRGNELIEVVGGIDGGMSEDGVELVSRERLDRVANEAEGSC